MYIVNSREGAIGLIVFALFALGTWPAIFLLCERRGRLPQHTYLDYAMTNYATAVVVALTLGQIGPSTPETPNFITQLYQQNGSSVGFAMAGGVFLCFGNLSVQYALAFLGVSITEMIATCLTVMIGSTCNYFLDGRINRATILFPGVACFMIAAVLASFTHASNSRDHARKLAAAQDHENKSVGSDIESMKANQSLEKCNFDNSDATDTSSESAVVVHAPGSAGYLRATEEKRAIKVSGKRVYVGLAIATFAGCSFGLFSPSFNLAVNGQWHHLPEGVPHLVVYTAFFYFSTSFFVVAILLNITMLYRPLFGLPKSSIGAWLRDWKNRQWALLAGVLCGLGNTAQFMGGQAAGYAAAEAVQGFSIWCTILGIIFFGEYRRSSSATKALLACTISMFIGAVALLMSSAGTRK